MDDATKQHLLLGREHYAKREYERAEFNLREVLKSAQQFADVHNMLGVISHDRGDFQEARKSFETALSINPNYTEAALNLAVTYNDLGMYHEAKRVYEQMVRRESSGTRTIEPFARGKLANLHAQVAEAYSELGLYFDSAAEYRKALWLCPHFADLRTKLGTVLRDMGDLEAAEREYSEALAQNPSFVPARVLLGITLFSLGKRSEAEQHWNEAIRLDPENKSAKMYLRMVKSGTLSQPPPRKSSGSMRAVKPPSAPKPGEGDKGTGGTPSKG